MEFELKNCNTREKIVPDPDLDKSLTDKNIRQYNGQKYIKILCSSDYSLIRDKDYKAHCVGSGTWGHILLAREHSTGSHVVVKISKEPLQFNLPEFCLQQHAKGILGESTPQFKGFLQGIHNNVPYYLPVMQFCPVTPDARVALTVSEALDQHHMGKPILTKDEWLSLSLTTLELVNRLNLNNIYHLDLNLRNILIVFGENDVPRPIVIDYGLSRYGRSDEGNGSMFNPNPQAHITFAQVAPECFVQDYPEESTDLYGAVYILSTICAEIFGLHGIQEKLGYERSKPPSERPGYEELKLYTQLIFDELRKH